ncbi:MAG TPA: 2-oxoacid:acceptor oxidoreductase subunit alpha [Planctomycetota bacterium]|nr:2-oxoacid:acceptor oxidoreductase subunit alpha [Planctomycetota bacterium]
MPVINEFTLAVATVNGSGSASSNTILAKTIFRMGVPVAAKNYFPSNIAGLPTWYVVRVTEKGWLCRSGRHDFTVAFNEATAEDDIRQVAPGGVLLIDEELPQAKAVPRDDITVYKVPAAHVARDFGPDPRLRKLLANMVYVGAVGELLGLDPAVLERTVHDQFSGKEKVVKLNLDVVHAGSSHAREHFDKAACPFRVETRNLTKGKLLIDGNTACAIGALMGGATVVAWYPITPSSSLCEAFIELCKAHRVGPDGEHRFVQIQAEDELASIGLVLGAGWAGARAFTATAGPGISLMSEFTGFGYYAEVPGVIVDVQRVGPSTGMPTRTQQSDVKSVYRLSHGDTEHIVLMPAGPVELYELTSLAFDLAERYQTPVFVLTDLDLGMNIWVSDPLPYPGKALDRGKVLDKEALKTVAEFARYKDVDGDGIPYRTLPGTHHPRAPYFTRGSGHTESATYTENDAEYRTVLDRLKRKIAGSTRSTPRPVIGGEGDIGLIHFGSSSFAVDEAREILAKEGLRTRSCRIRALPLHDDVAEFVRGCKAIHVVEQNRDGQLADIVRLKVPECATKVRSILEYGGLPLPAHVVVEALRVGAKGPKEAVHAR